MSLELSEDEQSAAAQPSGEPVRCCEEVQSAVDILDESAQGKGVDPSPMNVTGHSFDEVDMLQSLPHLIFPRKPHFLIMSLLKGLFLHR